MQVEKLKTIDADTLLSTPIRKTLFVVDGLIRQHRIIADEDRRRIRYNKLRKLKEAKK